MSNDAGDLCKSPLLQTENTAGNLGYAMANLIGIGGFLKNDGGSTFQTPLDKLKLLVKSQNATIEQLHKDHINTILSLDTEMIKGLETEIETYQQETEDYMKYNRTLLENEIDLNYIYIIFIYSILFVILIYIIIKL